MRGIGKRQPPRSRSTGDNQGMEWGSSKG